MPQNYPAPPPGYILDPNDPTRAIPAPSAPSPFGNRPIIHEAPPPPKEPREPKTTWQVLSPQEVAAHPGLDPGHGWAISSDGEPKDLGKLTPEDSANTKLQQAMEASRDTIASIERARKLVSNWSTGLGGAVGKIYPGSDQAKQLDTVVHQELRGNIFQNWVNLLKAQSATGTSGIGRIMQSEIPLVTGALGALDPVAMGKDQTLQSFDQIEGRILRQAAMLHGENPDDPKVTQKYRSLLVPASSGGSGADGTGGSGGTGADASGGNNGGPGGNFGGAGGDGVITPTNGQQRSTFDPRASSQIDALMNAGASLGTINAVLKRQNLSPITPASYTTAKQWMAKNPGQKYFGSNINRTEDLNLGQRILANPAVAPVAAAATIAGDTASGGLLGAATGDEGRGAIDAMRTLHPDIAPFADVAGGVAGAYGGEGLAGTALSKVLPQALKYAPVLGDMLYGGALGFNRAQPGEGGMGALEGAATGLGGNLLMKGAGRVVRGISDPMVQLLRSKGIPLTVGQALSKSGFLGNLVTGAENRASGFWGVGDVVKARQREGVEAVANRMANDAVAPIGGTASGYGESTANDLLAQGGNAYDRATAGTTVPVDPALVSDVAKVRALGTTLPPDLGAKLNLAITNRIDPVLADTQLTGDTFQQAVRGLKGYRAEATKPGFEQDYRNYLGQGIDALKGQMIRGGGSDVVDNLANADQAWKNIKVFQAATNAARNGARSGEVGLPMPSQFNDAATAAAAKYGGPRFNGDLLDAAQSVLPNKVPDSGTAGRMAFGASLPALLGATAGGAVGGGSGAEEGAGAGLGLTLLAAVGGSKPAQRVMVKALADRPDLVRKAGNLIYSHGWLGSGVLTPLLTGSGQ